jgi:FKBP-type peptidyl-prolyl cis-trans isomerase SlyD
LSRKTRFNDEIVAAGAAPDYGRPMSDTLAIADGLVVVLNYTLRSNAGKVLESSTKEEPLAYLHGADNIVPGLERALTGKTVGYNGKVVVEPGEGYGEREDIAPQPVPRAAFPKHVELFVGMQLMAEGPNHEHAPIWIAGIEGDEVLVDSQHPLAGETLNFEVEVLAVRKATEEEQHHGHPHGPDGHAGHHH